MPMELAKVTEQGTRASMEWRMEVRIKEHKDIVDLKNQNVSSTQGHYGGGYETEESHDGEVESYGQEGGFEDGGHGGYGGGGHGGEILRQNS